MACRFRRLSEAKINKRLRNAVSHGLCQHPLEVSSKSELPLGRALGPFNLKAKMGNGSEVSVENMYQSSKVFQAGGPYRICCS